MPESTEIEKKSLEAHVELCGERYRFLQNQLHQLDEKITQAQFVIREVHDKIEQLALKRNDQIMTWGAAMLTGLVAIVGYLLAFYVIK